MDVSLSKLQELVMDRVYSFSFHSSVLSLAEAAISSYPGKCESTNYMNWPSVGSKSDWGLKGRGG